MKALILAAGYGQRMRPLSDSVHKTMLSVGGQTIIDRILYGLRLHGVSDVWIVTGYRAEELREHVTGHHQDLAFHFVHNERFDKTNNIYSMALAFEQMTFDDDLILIESDLIYEPAVLDRLLKSSRENVALVDRYRPGMDGTVVTLNSAKVVTQVIPPSLQSDNFDYTDKYKTLNIYRFSKEFCATTLRRLLTYYARVIDDNCYYELILGMLIYMQQAQIHAEILTGEQWHEIDDPNDLRLAEFSFVPSQRYAFLEENWGGTWGTDVLDFAFIRNMHFPTPAMVSELRLHLPNLLHTYGSRQSVVNTKLAWALNWRAEHTYALAGASQCYPWLRRLFAGRSALIPTPTFGEYNRIFPDAARYADRPGVHWSEIEEKAQEADVVVFVNPNNPTGTTIATSDIDEFCQRNPDKTVIVDESFLDFSDQISITSFVGGGRLTNVVVLKSLSKSLGVPGMRIGALYTENAEVASWIQCETPIWNINSVGENYLEIMLKNRTELALSYERTKAERADLVAMLGRLPTVAEVYPSGANFLLTRFKNSGEEAGRLAGRLAEKWKIHVKNVSSKFETGDGYWRIAVRTPEDHNTLYSTISDLAPGR
ncbi:MAG: aminotransferase class I/II-fold pyridoxal phosphate-dependent enzyme [Dehalococcoidia bacterium]